MLVHMLFFFNDTATTEIYTLSLHDALPISVDQVPEATLTVDDVVAPTTVLLIVVVTTADLVGAPIAKYQDRKSTRLNSSHANISYAVFCLKKKINIHCLVVYYRWNYHSMYF